jgi:eukaryotic-like serine/threonine-protein kinase
MKREEEIFERALALTSAEARADYLLKACAGTPIFAGAWRNCSRRTRTLTEKPGDRIGRYKLLQQIGEGGCGVVYMAEQQEPVRRRVALKVIKLGMDTKAVIARFEAERQALALMDHPNIAKVFDAGATETGRPYFVMELVRGVKITDYCDQHNLSTRERLELFIQVCHAIQHAHQKGIIHRDIKPSNILVMMADDKPVPKVIDFGIAKATAQQTLTDKTLFTAFEQFIGTRLT